MSDLAPFVAANLRDKVVADLMKENAGLQKQLNAYRSIRLLHVDGYEDDRKEDVRVIAQGQLEEGDYHGPTKNLFSVNLTQNDTYPLSELENVWVSVGGYQRDNIHRDNYFALLYEELEGDTDDTKIVSLTTNLGKTWIEIGIHGWPREHYTNVTKECYHLAGDEIFYFILERVSKEFPNATVQFRKILLSEPMNKLAIQNR